MSQTVDPSNEDYASEILAYNQFMKPIYEQAFAHLLFHDSSKGLDFGCGPGGLLPALCELMGEQGQITAVDASPAHLQAAQQLCAEKDLTQRVALQQVDLRVGLPFADSTFDWVWAADVLHPQYFSTPHEVVGELVRVTKPGGCVAIFFEKMYESKLFAGRPHLDTLYRRYLDYHGRKLAFDNHPNNLHGWLRRNGCDEVQLHAFTMIHRSPLAPEARHYLQNLVASWFSDTPMERVIDAGIRSDEWDTLVQAVDPTSPSCVFDHPDYYCVWIALMAVGRKPA